MKIVFKFWLVLFPTLAIGRFLVSLQGHNHLDLRFEVFAQIIIIPLVQSLVLTLVISGVPWRELLDSIRRLISNRYLAIFVCLDFLILILTWSLDFIHLTNPDDPVRFYLAAKSMAVGGGMILIALTTQRLNSERLLQIILGLGFIAYGYNFVQAWILEVPNLLFPDWPLLYRWVFVFVPAFLFILLIFLRVTSQIGLASPASATFLNAALFLVTVGTCIVLLNTFNRPFLTAPWDLLVSTCSYLAVSLVLIGVTLVHFPSSNLPLETKLKSKTREI